MNTKKTEGQLVCIELATAPLVSRGSEFKRVKKGGKKILKPSQDLNRRIKLSKTTTGTKMEYPINSVVSEILS